MRYVFSALNPPPPDLHRQDLSDSYFGGIAGIPLNITGINLSGCDLTNATFAFCNADGADLSGATTYGAYCRHNTWVGAKLPADCGFLVHEWVAEIFRAAAQGLTGAKKTMVLKVVQFILAGYDVTHSWSPGWQVATSNVSAATVKATLAAFLAPYPNLTWRLARLLEEYGIAP